MYIKFVVFRDPLGLNVRSCSIILASVDGFGMDFYIMFDDLFDDALREPVIDVFVVKLRYRLGN